MGVWGGWRLMVENIIYLFFSFPHTIFTAFSQKPTTTAQISHTQNEVKIINLLIFIQGILLAQTTNKTKTFLLM